MKTKRITLMALLTASALITFIIEAQIPSLTAISGIKIGLSNIFTVFALWTMGAAPAMGVLIVRVVLGCLLTGQPTAIIYSMAGGFLALGTSIIIKGFFSRDSMWALSAISGVLHNAGQLITAVLVTETPALFVYAPVLVISGTIAGSFTGFCVQLVIGQLEKTGVLPLSKRKK